MDRPDGSGDWRYICVVDGAGNSSGIRVPDDSAYYARACILLYESETLDAGSFKPVMANGEPAVLMQSSIRRGEAAKDATGLDPQNIYDADGKMYMASGSVGSGTSTDAAGTAWGPRPAGTRRQHAAAVVGGGRD